MFFIVVWVIRCSSVVIGIFVLMVSSISLYWLEVEVVSSCFRFCLVSVIRLVMMVVMLFISLIVISVFVGSIGVMWISRIVFVVIRVVECSKVEIGVGLVMVCCN